MCAAALMIEQQHAAVVIAENVAAEWQVHVMLRFKAASVAALLQAVAAVIVTWDHWRP